MGETYFSPELFKFLSQLKKNNKREWFQANKSRFEDVVREPVLNFISAAGPQLRKITPHVVADPRPVGGSMFRIHRDVRFTKDKSPYKTNVGAYFKHAAGKEVSAPGYYLHLSLEMCFLAGGMYMPDPKALRTVRETIADHPEKWKAVLRSKLDLSDEGSLVRPPQGFDAAHLYIEDIKRKSFVTSVEFTQAQVCGPKFMESFVSGCRTMNPLMRFLAQAVGVAW